MTLRTLVLGASLNPERYSHLCMLALEKHGLPAVGIGLKEGKVGNTEIHKGTVPLENIHTVTMYLNARRQEAFYDYIFELKPSRIIFNPGAENAELASMARKKGIDTLEACTLVLLSTGQFVPESHKV